MKICNYKRETALGTFQRLGIFYNSSTIIDVNLLWQALYEEQNHFGAKEKAARFAPASLSELLKINDNSIEFLKETIGVFEDLTKKGMLHTKDKGYFSFDMKDDKSVKLGIPIDKMNSYRDFYIHEKHVKKGFEKRQEPMPEAWYEMPVFYKGPTTSFIPTDELIPWPSFTKKLDYELELGAIIGKQGTNIPEEKAYDYIFGYTILNDISARDIQKKEMSVRLGPAKGKDFCSIIGPVIVTADEFKFKEPDLLMTARINEQEWSRGKSSDANFTWAQIIAHLSKEEWIYPTDFLGSGTVGTGCGLELDKWIQPGDIVELEIEKIGILKNIVGTPNKEA